MPRRTWTSNINLKAESNPFLLQLREELAEQKLEQAEQLAHEIAEKKQQLDAVKKAAKQQ